MKTAFGLLLPEMPPPQLHLLSSVVKAPKKPSPSILFSHSTLYLLQHTYHILLDVTIICACGLAHLLDSKALELTHFHPTLATSLYLVGTLNVS